MTSPITEAVPSIPGIESTDDSRITTEQLHTPYPIRKGDHITLLYDSDGNPAITCPIHGSPTLKSILQSISNGLDTIIDPTTHIDNRTVIYQLISRYIRSSDRINYIRKFEAGTLHIKDLLVYDFFDGNLRRITTRIPGHNKRPLNVWIYSSGS